MGKRPTISPIITFPPDSLLILRVLSKGSVIKVYEKFNFRFSVIFWKRPKTQKCILRAYIKKKKGVV